MDVVMLAAIDNAQAVAWICLFVGIVVLGVGLVTGVRTTFATPSRADTTTVDDLRTRLDETADNLTRTRIEIQQLKSRGLEAGGPPDTTGAADAVTAAESSTSQAKSALQQVESAISSLPENLRFSGLLVLIGAVLMSVATIQFGGTSLF